MIAKIFAINDFNRFKLYSFLKKYMIYSIGPIDYECSTIPSLPPRVSKAKLFN